MPDEAMVRARQAFPASRGMLALDRALQRRLDGKGKVERAIIGALGAGIALLWLGWVLGRKGTDTHGYM